MLNIHNNILNKSTVIHFDDTNQNWYRIFKEAIQTFAIDWSYLLPKNKCADEDDFTLSWRYLLLPHRVGLDTSSSSSSSVRILDFPLPVMKFQHDRKNHMGEMKRNRYHARTQAINWTVISDTFMFLRVTLYSSTMNCTCDSRSDTTLLLLKTNVC